MKKVYYQMFLTQASPLRIGNGQHADSDNDLMLDGRGLPFIPGTSIAGIIRHKAETFTSDEQVLMNLFGVVIPGDNTVAIPSRIIIGDAVLGCDTSNDNVLFGRRDGVGLEEWGTAKKKSKFDFQISETDSVYRSIIEWTGNDDQYQVEIEKIIEPILKHYIASGFEAGARTSRGYGKFTVLIKKKLFNFPEELEQWMDFNPYSDNAFDDEEVLEGNQQSDSCEITLNFDFISPFSVRVNTAKTEIMEDGSVPDAVPMENYKGNPVIPGTAWAGSFRHHMHDLLRDAGFRQNSEEILEVDKVFGIEGSGSCGRSKISFSESEINIKDKDNQKTSVMRTAIDRFTAAPSNTALFTNMVYSGGNGILHISFEKESLPEKYLELLAACICDLHLGLITVGGEASVGRGIMRVTGLKYNGVDILDKMLATIDNNSSLDWLEEEKNNG